MNLRMSTAPHIRSGVTTRQLMGEVALALLPCAIVGIYRFGTSALMLLLVAILSAMVAELLAQLLMKRPVRIGDGSAALTGLILGLNLPPTAPWWIAAIGSAVAIILVKQLFGGIGDNFLNPAIAARAILLASWPVYMTSYVAPGLAGGTDVVSMATPLITGSQDYFALFMGDIPGTIGEVGKFAILIGAAYLIVRKVIAWQIPASMLASLMIMTLILGGDPLAAVLSGGVLFCAVFMATDYTTSPMSAAGQIIFGCGTGLIVAFIRKFGAYPEGATYGLLIMNIITPLIDKYMRPKLFGRPEKEVKTNA